MAHAAGTSALSEAHRLAGVEADLVRELSLAPDVVHEAVSRAARDLEAAPVRDFVPVLASRIARQELRRSTPA